MICLDTTFLIDFFKKRIILDEKLESYLREELIITPFSIFELYQGIFRLKRKDPKFNFKKREMKIQKFYNKFTIFDYTSEAAIKTAEILDYLEKMGKIIDVVDVMIASIALTNNCDIIITRNANHFNRISGLSVISYELKI